MTENLLKDLLLLKSKFYDIDFKSQRSLKKCIIENSSMKEWLLVTDGMGKKYLVEISSIEKVTGAEAENYYKK